MGRGLAPQEEPSSGKKTENLVKESEHCGIVRETGWRLTSRGGDAAYRLAGEVAWDLTQRLEDLEARAAPAAEPVIFQSTYVSPDGSEEDGPRFELPTRGPSRQRKRR